MPILSRYVDQKSLETEFLIAICRHTGDKWQSKTLFLSIFDLPSSIVDSIFDCHLPGVTVSFFPSQFFPRGKNGPAHSFPGEKTDRSVFSPGERFD